MPPNLEEIEIEYEPQDEGVPRDLPSKFISDLESPSPQVVLQASSIQSAPAFALPPPPRSAVPDMLQALTEVPEVRPIPWKLGQELPLVKGLEHERSQVRGAVLLSARGKVAESPCNRCARGTGRFEKCVYLDNWFLGACATCQFSSKGNLCSLRTEREAALSGKKSKKQAAKNFMPYSPSSDTINVEPSLKRKRMPPGRASQPQKQSRTSYSNDESDARYPTTANHSSKSAAYEKAFDDDPSALLQFVYQRQNALNGVGNKRHSQYLGDPEEPGSRPVSNRHNGFQGRGSHLRDVGEGSYSPAIQHANNEGDPYQSQALIDVLPRKKQKQIFGIIGGLQSGIRSSRQQTENLQRQLDALQLALGIDPEETGYL